MNDVQKDLGAGGTITLWSKEDLYRLAKKDIMQHTLLLMLVLPCLDLLCIVSLLGHVVAHLLELLLLQHP